MPAFLSDNQYTWTLVITIAVIASLEPETGSEPRSTLRTLAGGSYLPRTTWSSGTWKAGKQALKLTHQDGARAGPESCSRGLRTLGMRGLTLSPAWRTMLGSGCVNRSGGARGQAGCGVGSSEVSTAPAWIWLDGRWPQPVLVTQPVSASKSPSRPGLKTGGQCRDLEKNRKVDPWAERLDPSDGWWGGRLPAPSVLACGYGGWALVTSAARSCRGSRNEACSPR